MRWLRLAWRNVFRHRRRTMITFAAISAGIAYMILMDSFMGGFELYSMRSFVDQEAGHLKLHAEGYRDEENVMPLDIVISDPDAVMDAVRGEFGYDRLTARTAFRGELSDGVDQLPVVGIGIDTATDRRVFDYPKAVTRGCFLTDRLDLLVGQNLAQDMDIDTGAYVTVVARTRNESWNALDFTVTGLLGTSDMFIDMNSVVMNIETADELLQMNGAVTEIPIRLASMDAAAPAKRQFEAAARQIPKLAGLEAWTWRELGEMIFQITGTKQAGGVHPDVRRHHHRCGRHHQHNADGRDGAHPRNRHSAGARFRFQGSGRALPVGRHADRRVRQHPRRGDGRRRGTISRLPRP